MTTNLLVATALAAAAARWRRANKSAASEDAALELARKVAFAEFLVLDGFPRRQPSLADVTKASFAGAGRATMT
jgi:hypothetical protein